MAHEELSCFCSLSIIVRDPLSRPSLPQILSMVGLDPTNQLFHLLAC